MSQQVQEILSSLRGLAPFPQVAVKAMRLRNNEYATPSDFIEIIETDPGISAAVLREANSAARGAVEICESIRDAGNQLGTRKLNRILMKACARDCFNGLGDSTPRSSRSLWNECVVTACTARFLAMQDECVDSDLAYTIGLLQNVGHIALDRYLGDARSEIQSITRHTGDTEQDAIELINAERRVLGIDHAEIGAKLAKRWGFPEELVNAIAFHHEPERAQRSALCTVTSYAEQIAWRLLESGAACFEREGRQPLESLIEVLAEEGIAIAA